MAVLMCFGAMKWLDIGANVVALSGIAIAIGTMVDMGIVVCENILKHRQEASPNTSLTQIILKATSEVSHAVLTALSTTVISFLPVCTMEAAEGKLFKPLAWTKTLALISALLVSLFVIPVAARLLMAKSRQRSQAKTSGRNRLSFASHWIFVALICLLLARFWSPMGPASGLGWNLLFITCLVWGVLGIAQLIVPHYSRLLKRCLQYRKTFLSLPLGLVLMGLLSWLGFERCLGWLPSSIRLSTPSGALAHTFPGLGREFMPPLDEGSFLYMPPTMPHASIGESMDAMRKQDMAISGIPEIETVVGKLGRAETALDPAPVSMVETIIQYHAMFLLDENGKRRRFAWDGSQTDWFRKPNGDPVSAPEGKPYQVQGRFQRDESDALIPDAKGIPFRLWRPALSTDLNPERLPWRGIHSPEDIWDEIVAAAEVPGSTSAPKLQPIAARLVMLQTGMRAPMGIKIKGPDLKTIESVGVVMEKWLKQVPQVQSSAVIADRIIGKPYMEIEI
ncbi:MAG: efflux RND transporter permease subunit, partial [Roseibacillus sp.]|nr:efflux RND transporter permease subunit [Roseibacillus sp.]